MRVACARSLLRKHGFGLDQKTFEEAMMAMIRNDEQIHGTPWLSRHAWATHDPEESAWEGVVRCPEASLMPYQAMQLGDQQIFINLEYLEELQQSK